MSHAGRRGPGGDSLLLSPVVMAMAAVLPLVSGCLAHEAEDARTLAEPAQAGSSSARPVVAHRPRPASLSVPAGLDDDAFHAHLGDLAGQPSGEVFSEAEVRGWWAADRETAPMPDKDWRRHPKIAAIGARRWAGGPQRSGPHFARPIPRIVHQLEDPELTAGEDHGHAAWAAWAQRFGYVYQRWSAQDAPSVLPAANLALFRGLAARGERIAAGQVLAASVMAQHGGLWMGRHAAPPTAAGVEVDLDAYLPMKGLVAVTAPSSRLLSDVSTWVLWDALLACPQHPVLLRLQAQLPQLVDVAGGPTPLEPAYATGSVLLSEVLGGAHTLVPAHTARRIGLLPAVDLDR